MGSSMEDRRSVEVQVAKATGVVRRAVHEWDPYGLLAMGAPGDEWDSEILRLVGEVPQINSEWDAALVLSRIFSAAFQPKGFSPEECAAAGKRLFEGLREAGFPLNSMLGEDQNRTGSR
jgi:hypothetical protein